MGAEFASLNLALSSLYAQRRGLEVTGQNLANVNTEGYSRQRVTFTAAGGSPVAAIFSTSTGIGEGVRYNATERLRDSLLEMRANAEHGALAKNLGDTQLLLRLEQAFAEPGPLGLQAMLGNFWNGFDDVANHPEDVAARAQLLQRAQTLVAGFQQVGAYLDVQWNASREQLATVVNEINTTAANVADLNAAILQASKAGMNLNELMDTRDVLIQKLATLGGVTTKQGEGGVIDVYLGGTALVRGDRAEDLTVGGATTFDGVMGGGQVTVQWAKDNYPVTLTGGQAGALAQALNTTLPSYRKQLEDVVQQLVTDVNDLHASGFDLDGNTGQPFFKITGSPLVGLEVAITKPEEIAASGSASSKFDGSIALQIAELAGKKADLAYRKFIVDLGVDTQTAQRRAEIQQAITDRIDAYRDADSGVNIDEEMTNMVAYQQAYSAAARFLTAVDEVIDTLINRTGHVGR